MPLLIVCRTWTNFICLKDTQVRRPDLSRNLVWQLKSILSLFVHLSSLNLFFSIRPLNDSQRFRLGLFFVAFAGTLLCTANHLHAIAELVLYVFPDHSRLQYQPVNRLCRNVDTLIYLDVFNRLTKRLLTYLHELSALRRH